MTVLRPAMPFPPHGTDGGESGIIDLGIRLRDSVFRRQHVERAVRGAIIERFTEALEAEDHARALPLLVALLDSFPLASMVDDARERWTDGPDGAALAVLARVSALLGLLSGNTRPWPSPSRAWLKRVVGNRIITGVQERSPGDGAAALATFFETRLLPAPDDAPPLSWEHPLGPMGAEVDDAPAWHELLTAPPAPVPADSRLPRALAEVIRLPATPVSLERGELDPTPWLVWDGPHAPVPVTSPAALVLSRLDGRTSPATLASELQAPEAAVRKLVDALAAAGACTSFST